MIKAIHKNETEEHYWHKYSKKQIDTVKRICILLASEYGIKTIVGHDDIAPGRKIDPGPAFPDIKDFTDSVLSTL